MATKSRGRRYNITFDFVEKEYERKGKKQKAILLVDNSGYICGVYRNYKEAKIAIPKIRRNILKEYRRREINGRSIPAEAINS